jgi:elongation factor G
MTAPELVRNVVLLGHHASGKTTLAEALLARSGATARVGRVEDASTVCDHEPEEHRHGHSLSLAMAPFVWRDHLINLIDAPGAPDFVSEALAALDVADLAIVVVSGVDGVEAVTEQLWNAAAERDIPRMVFVNKLDRENSSFDRTVAQLRQHFGDGIEVIELPVGEASELRGVADLLSESAYIYDHGTAEQVAVPAELVDREHAEHDRLVEDIVSGDDELLERFLDGQVPTFDELEATLAREVDLDLVFPVLCGSATTGIGVDRLADFIVEIGPSPLDRPGRTVQAGNIEVTIEPDPSGAPLAMVFKTIADPFVGQLSLFRVLSGTIRSDDRLVNPRTRTTERLHGVFRLFGREQRPVDALTAGDIGGVAKLSGTRTGDVLGPANAPVHLAHRERPAPMFRVGVVARTQSDEDKLSSALSRLVEEDPALSVERDEVTRQLVLGGAGETHLQVALERLERAFGVHVDLHELHIAYRETIARAARAEGKYKKQSGGHGQFGVAVVEAEPMARGGGFEFVDQVVGGAIPRQFISAVEHGVIDTMGMGGLYGFPVVDVRVRCVDGKSHSVDSSEMSFKMAGSLAFREALAAAGSVVLEPISTLRVRVPADFQGDVLGDINARRGRIIGSEAIGSGNQEITAQVPTAELTRYVLDLRSMTRGRGQFTAVHDHYDPLPDHLVAKVARRTPPSNGH